MEMKILAVALLLIGTTCAQAHSFISSQFITGEKAIEELQNRRDTIINSPIASDQEKQAAQAYVATAFTWNKLKLSVCFWQVDDQSFLQAVKAQANLWSVGTRIEFDFGGSGFRRCVNENSADIRVTFKQFPPSYYAAVDRPLAAWDWSEYGNLPSQTRAKVSMSLVHAPEDFKLATALGKTVDFNFLVAHEFGHALGLIHEHQRIDCSKYLASKKQVMETYGFTKDFDYDTFVKNLKQIPASDATLRPVGVGRVDVARSVTVYNFPVKIWADGSNPCARPEAVEHPDRTDIAGVNFLYGAPSPPAAAAVASRRGGEAPPPPAAPPTPGPTVSAGSAISKEDAQKILLQSYQTHLRIAQALDSNTSRGGGATPEERHATAEARRGAAINIQNLLNAMKRARETSR